MCACVRKRAYTCVHVYVRVCVCACRCACASIKHVKIFWSILNAFETTPKDSTTCEYISVAEHSTADNNNNNTSFISNSTELD